MKTGKLCRRPGVKWHVSGKPLILPTVAGIMMIVLFFTGCASTRKSRTEVNRNSSLSSSADKRVKREAGAVDGGDSEIGGEPDDPSGQPP